MLSDLGIWTDVDVGPDTLNKKIRNGEIAQYNFLLGGCFFVMGYSTLVLTCTFKVVGEQEQQQRSVNVRNRDDVGTKARGTVIPIDTISQQLVKLKTSRSLKNQLPDL
jgi:threonyl-tRNA synthetase